MSGVKRRALPVDAWTDFICAYSFLTCLALHRLENEVALAIHWRSMLVRPPGLPPLSPGMRKNASEARAAAARRARAEFQLELNPGPMELDTLRAHTALKHAERLGLGNEAHLAIMKAYWLYAERIDRPDALEAVLRPIGLNGSSIPWDDPLLADTIDADIGLAQSLDLYFVPALRFGERTIVAGAEPYDHLLTAARLAASEAVHPAGHTDVQRPGLGGRGAPAS